MPQLTIRVRSYNVGFGDCFLVTVSRGTLSHHTLIDFGNAPGKSGSNESFPAIAANILKETKGQLDLLVMTHEHLDHMEGFYAQRNVFDEMKIKQVWMSLPSAPGYYEDHPRATPLKKLRDSARKFAKSLALKKMAVAPSFASLLQNNLANADRIEYVRKLSKAPVQYLCRGRKIKGAIASLGMTFHILAPEKDVSVYYGKNQKHMGLMLGGVVGGAGRSNPWTFPKAKRVQAPSNIEDTEWHRLKQSIQTGIVEAIQTIDKAQNNTSLVFLLEVGGKRLLFSGDAELESWECMKKFCKTLFKPVDFLKVSHHGSWNGTPLDILDDIMPVRKSPTVDVMVSTKSKVYGTTNPVPDQQVLAELKRRSRRLVSTDGNKAEWIDIHL